MQKYQNNVTNRAGDAVRGLQVTVNVAGGGLATIYSDNVGTVRSNPLTTDASGYFEFYAADGRYNITVPGGGYTDVMINDTLLGINGAVKVVDLEADTGATLVGTTTGTVQADLDARPTAAALAAAGGAAGIGDLSSDTGAELRTQAEVNADTIHLFGSIPKSQQAAILGGTSVYDATADLADFMAACATRKKIGITPGGKVCYQTLALPAGFPGMRGEGSQATLFQHIAGTAGASVYVPAGRINYPVFENLFFQGYGTAAETTGFDLTGISYGCFRNVKISGFYSDNWTGTGYIVTAGEDRSSIVNAFYDCIGGSSVTGKGLSLYAPLVAYNTASLVGWAFFGGYFVANAGGQLYARFGENISFNDTKIEASAGGLIDIDACNNFNFRGYAESRSNDMWITIGATAENYSIVPTRWSYPLWHMINPASVLGKGRIELAGNSPGRACFSNGDLSTVSFIGAPVDYFAVGPSTTAGYLVDTDSNKGVTYPVALAAGAGVGGFDIQLKGRAFNYFNKRVTVRLRYRATGGAASTLSIYTRVQATNNGANGQYYARTFAPSTAYRDLFADVVFPAKGVLNDSDNVYIRVLLSSPADNVTIYLDEFQVFEGGFAYPVGEPIAMLPSSGTRTTELTSLTAWPNILRKSRGRFIFDVTTLKAYVSTGATAAAPWQEIATGTLVTPT
jgi:hypothetical protein